MAQIKDYTEKTVLVGTEEIPIQNTSGGITQKTLVDTIKSYIQEPVGTIKAWDKTMPSTPSLTSSYKEMDGTSISDSDSVYNGYRIRNLNGANVVLTLTWTADGGGAYATAVATDVTALGVGDDVTGTGIAAGSYITDITGTTVTISDTAATGSISSTFTNDGLFVRGGATSGTGQKTAIQDHEHLQDNHNAGGTAGRFITVQVNNFAYDSNYTTGGIVDGSLGTVEIASESRPPNKSVVWIMKIK